MATLKTTSITEQVASHLREGIQTGRWKGLMLGRNQLAKELGTSSCSVQRALEVLEREGLLVSQGGGRRRKIMLQPAAIKSRVARIGILPFGPENLKMAFLVDLKHQLIEAGHSVSLTSRTLADLRMEVPRIARMVQKHEVDAWVVIAGPHKVLEWFAAQQTPVFAFTGFHYSLSIAGCGKASKPATKAAMNRLISLGHRRIVFLLRSQLKSPPCNALQAFVNELESHDIPVGDYNLPNWKDTPEGLHQCLDSLFATTPPTALLVDEPELFLAAYQHLAGRGIVAPRDVSLICTDPNRAFDWFQPTIAHNTWSVDPMVRRVVRWVGNVSQGKDDRRKTTVKTEFVEGGTIGPATNMR